MLNVDNQAPGSISNTILAAQKFLSGLNVTYDGITATGLVYVGPSGTYKLSNAQRSLALALTSDLSAYNASGV